MCCFLLVFGACQSKQKPKIDLKAQIQADKNAKILPTYKRIVIIGDELIEMVCALGDSLKIVAVGKNYPKLAHRKLPLVGYKGSLRAEYIKQQKADVVIADADMLEEKVAESIEDLGIPCYRLSKPQTPKELETYLKELGRMLRQEKKARQWIDTLDYNIARIEKICKKKRKDTLRAVYIQARSADAILLNGTGTLCGLMLHVAGLKNAASLFDGLQPLSVETMQAINPDFIIISKRSLNSLQGRPQDIPQFTTSQAYRMGRVLVLEDDELQGLPLRTGKTSLFICKKIYQENFYNALPLLDNIEINKPAEVQEPKMPRRDKVEGVTPTPVQPKDTKNDLEDLKGGN